MEIPLRGKYSYRAALVDDADAPLADVGWRGRGSASSDTIYAQAKAGRRRTRSMHREVMERALGRQLTRGERVDHINGDGLDNRRRNLRLATHGQNMRNRCSARGATSRYLGVHYDAPRDKWRAQINAGNGRMMHLGRFESEDEAARAYNVAAARIHGEFARLNVTPAS